MDDIQPQKKQLLTVKDQLRQTWDEYQNYAPAAFFIFGFLFDIVTLERVDSSFQIIQQAVYIFIVLILLGWNLFETQKTFQVPRGLITLHKYRTEILHFFIGGLLSAFTLFFIKSGSLFSSFLFLGLMAAILVANEFSRVQGQGLGFKFGLFALILVCYMAYLIPTLIGSVGFGVLLLTVAVTGVIIYGINSFFCKKLPDPTQVTKTVLRPGLIVLLVFVGMYWFGFIPPVPLSLKYVGIYKAIERTPERNYKLLYERPWYKFWQNGDQTFLARPGDQIVTFVRVFSPTRFEDSIQLHFLKNDPKRGWEDMDKIKFSVNGGRDEGFRGYGIKSNFDAGDWRVQVETLDGRELGRLYFEVEKTDEQRSKEYKADYF